MRIKQILLLLSTGSFLIILTGGIFHYQSLKSSALKSANQQATLSLKKSSLLISKQIQTYQKGARCLALFPDIANSLENSLFLHNANIYLDMFNNSMNTDVCYLMNKDGLVIASSNRNQPDSFVGKNYSFRPYFTEAMKGNPFIYLGVGITSGKRGIYISQPIYLMDSLRPEGVIVIKVSPSEIEPLLKPYLKGYAMLCNKDGIIFMSTKKEWNLKSLWRISDRDQKRLKRSRQWGAGPWNWLGFHRVKGNIIEDRTKKEFLFFNTTLESLNGYYLIYIEDLKGFYKQALGPLRIHLITIAGLLIITGLGFGYIYLIARKDIQKRLDAETALKKSEEKYRTIIENIQEGYYEMDLRGNFQFVNKSYERIFGYSREELLGNNYKKLVDKSEQETLFNVFNEVYKTGNPVQGFKWHYKKRDGKTIYIEISISLIKDDKGSATGFRGFIRDITEKREAEVALKDEQERFRMLVEKSPFGIALIGYDGTYKYINPRFKEIFGYTLEDVPTGKEWFKRAFPDDNYREKAIKQWIFDLKGLKIGEIRSAQFEIRCKDGSIKMVDIRTLTLEGGEHIVFYEDITDKKKLEEQLLQSQKMEAIGRLAGGIAHDFNNILTAIIGNVDICKLNLSEGRSIIQNIDEIKRGAIRASELTRQLLAFSRKQPTNPVILNLNLVLKDMSKMIKRLIGEDIEVETFYQEGLWNVMADRAQLEQVIINIVINARDAMPKGGKLTLETENVFLDESYANRHDITLVPSQYVMLAITDTGTGMDEEVKEKIFEPFFTTKEKGKGTGLGLSTVYGIIKQNKGYIWVYSEPGKGTTFKVYLPRARDEEAGRKITDEIDTEEDIQGQETILVVEDDEAVLNLIKNVLERHGYSVIIAKNGVEAIDIFKRNKDDIDLLLTDVVMPGMNGKDLSDILVKMKQDLKTIYMSGYTSNAIVHHGIMKKDINFIQKPFTGQELLKEVKAALSSNKT